MTRTACSADGEITAATFERLRLTDKKICEMTRSMLAVAELPDPIGRVLQRTELDTDLVLEKVTCPLGVLAVIFEARPDAVTQISALGLKSANAVILKAGREVERTATALVDIIRRACCESGLPEDSVTLVTGRESVRQLLGYVRSGGHGDPTRVEATGGVRAGQHAHSRARPCGRRLPHLR